jgi:hypothetical protein
MSCDLNPGKRLGRPHRGISYSEAMTQATSDLRFRRLLMGSAAYRIAFRERMHEIMGANRVDPDGYRQKTPETGVNRVGFSHEPGVTKITHPGEPS